MHKADRIFPNLVEKAESRFSLAKAAGDWKVFFSTYTQPQAIRERLIALNVLDKGMYGGHFSLNLSQSGRCDVVIVNGAEFFPGHWKDAEIMCWEPHKVLEGAILLAKALGARVCCVVVHAALRASYKALIYARDELYSQSIAGDKSVSGVKVVIRMSNGLLSGAQNKSILRHLEGGQAVPTGPDTVFNKSTFFLNLETCASLAPLIARGEQWIKQRGVEQARGTRVFSISGAVCNPTLFEEEYGKGIFPLVEQYAGGPVQGWPEIEWIFPDGFLSSPLEKRLCDKLTQDPVSASKIGLTCNTGSMILLEKNTSLQDVMRDVMRYFHKESCGLCLGCREGFGHSASMLEERTYNADNIFKIMDFIVQHAECSYGSVAAKSVMGGLQRKKEPV